MLELRAMAAAALVFLSCSVAPAAEIPKLPASIEPTLIPNYKLIAPGLAAAGQPSAEALAQLKEYGFRTVINLRTAEEGAELEGEKLRAMGLAYLWVPITAASFSLKDVQAVGRVLSDPAAGPVLLHCASSNRVGGVLAVLAAQKGAGLAEAVEQGKAAGLKSAEMIDAVRRVAGELTPPQ
jgi:uncharacterized protein (TIGR01244 family)